MKKIIAIITLIAGSIAPANADVYVKVDANGNAIDSAIVCDAETCAVGSLFSQLTLKEGERYALQGFGQAGIGNNNPNTTVKVDNETNQWTYTTPSTVTTWTPQREPVYVTPIVTETNTVTIDTSTVLSDTTTAKIDTTTATISNVTIDSLYTQIMALFNQLLALIAKLNR